MAQAFGSVTGPIYPFGKITVATPGSPVAVSSTPSNYTPTGGAGSIQSYSAMGMGATGSTNPAPAGGNQAQMVCGALWITTPASNIGLTYLCFSGTSGIPGSKAAPGSVIVAVNPGIGPILLTVPNLENPFIPGALVVDADTASNALWVTAVIL